MAGRGIQSIEQREPEESPKIMKKPLPQILDEMEKHIAAVEAAATKAEEARKVAEEAGYKAETEAKEARESAGVALGAAEEALQKAQAALPRDVLKKVLTSWQFLTMIVLVLLASIWAAVSISLGVSLIGR